MSNEQPAMTARRPDRVGRLGWAGVTFIALVAAGCGGGGADAAPPNIDLGGGIVMTAAGEILVSRGGASNVDRTVDTPAAP